jgi:hypothetical protein
MAAQNDEDFAPEAERAQRMLAALADGGSA